MAENDAFLRQPGPQMAFRPSDHDHYRPAHNRDAPEQSKQLPKPPPMHLRWWKWEALGYVVTVASLVALIVGLREMDGEEERTWGFLTLNTVVAILTTIMSSSLMAVVSGSMSQSLWNWFAESPTGDKLNRQRSLKDLELFDNASRGPFGGLRLIWRLRGWHPASLGAFLTVLNLGLGAFTQQLVSTERRNLEEGPTSPFPRSEKFKSVPFQGEPYLSNEFDPDVYTKAAIYSAATGGNITVLLPSCVSGNCTYPPTPTLGMCGSCTDLSSRLNNTDRCRIDIEPYLCSYHLPSGASLTYNAEYAARDAWTIFNITGLSPVEALVYNDSTKLYALLFNTVGLPPATAFSWTNSSEGSEALPPMQAHECALWWCIQTYNVSVRSGSTDKTLLHTWSEMRQMGMRNRENFTNIPDYMNTQPGVTYGVEYASQRGVATALQTITLNPGDAVVQFLNGHGAAFRYGSKSSQSTDPTDITHDILQGAWHGSNNFHDHSDDDDTGPATGTGWIDNLARSLSNNIAVANPSTDTTSYVGTSTLPKSFFKIQWSYLAFPASLIVLALTFLALTMSETRRKLIRPWRVGLLPLLFIRVDDSLQARVAREHALDNPGGVDKLAEMELRLRQAENGAWVFERPGR